MCTMVVLYRPGHPWPLLFAANRDEMADRPWAPPARHWQDRANVVAGRDELAGGTWLGLNDYGLLAGISNREGSLGPAPDKRSRGELVLEALDHSDAKDAANALADVDVNAYRPFNMIVGDNRDVFWLCNRGGKNGPRGGQMVVNAVPPGISMVTSRDRNDAKSPRIHAYLPRFEAAEFPDPDAGEWGAWEALLASRVHDLESGPSAAMCVVTDTNYGTLSSSLIALPAANMEGRKPVWRFSAGCPGEVAYDAVAL